MPGHLLAFIYNHLLYYINQWYPNVTTGTSSRHIRTATAGSKGTQQDFSPPQQQQIDPILFLTTSSIARHIRQRFSSSTTRIDSVTRCAAVYQVAPRDSVSYPLFSTHLHWWWRRYDERLLSTLYHDHIVHCRSHSASFLCLNRVNRQCHDVCSSISITCT